MKDTPPQKKKLENYYRIKEIKKTKISTMKDLGLG